MERELDKNNICPVVIFDDHIAAYGVIRGLSKYNIPIYIISKTGQGVSTKSRYVSKCTKIGAKEDGFFEKACEWIHKEVGEKVVLIVAGSDEYLDVLASNYDRLPIGFLPTFPDSEKVDIVRKKWLTCCAANRVGVPIPKTKLVTSREELIDAFEDIVEYPIIMKAEDTFRLQQEFNEKIIKSWSLEDALKKYDAYNGFYGRLLIQEYIPGGEDKLLNLIGVANQDGELLASISNRKVRTSGEMMSCSLMTTIDNNEVVDLSRKIIKEIGYCGYVNPEFKYDERDGKLKLMEINGRVSMSCGHSVGCGVNLPYMMYNDALGNVCGSESLKYKGRKVLWWYPLGDIPGITKNRRGKNWSMIIREMIACKYVVEPFQLSDPAMLFNFISRGVRHFLRRFIAKLK